MKVIEVAGGAAPHPRGGEGDTGASGGGGGGQPRRRPLAVLVNYEAWQTWKRQRRAYLDRLSAEIDAGNFYTQEQVEAGLRERGLID